MNSNEKWQGKPASRDGKSFEKRDVKSILKGSRGASRSNTDNESRNYNRTDFKNRNESADSTGQKKKFELKDQRPYESRPPRSFNSDQNSDSRPRRSFNGDQTASDSRPRRSFNSDQNASDSRPRRSFNGDQSASDSRPRRSFNSDQNASDSRPRRSFDGEQRPYGDRPKRPFNGEQRSYDNNSNSDRPRFKPRTNSGTENFNRETKLTVKKPGESQLTDFVEYRFDNQNDQSNFRKPMRKRSGNYDPNAKYSVKKQLEYRKTVVDVTVPVRLNKFLANAGICSRREADDYIAAGVISVNDVVVTELGTKVMHSDKIMFHNQPVRSERKVYLVLNKPKDCVTTSEDTNDRMTVLDLVKHACSERIYPVGRLDRNTTGVILLTNDGDLASKLTHPKFEKKKIYHVTLDKPLTAEHFENILGGITLDDFKIAADTLEFVKDGDLKQIGIEIHSGQNRVVRRIFEKLGYRVIRLDRVYFAGLTKKNLPRGKYRFLNEREVNMLKMGAYE